MRIKIPRCFAAVALACITIAAVAQNEPAYKELPNFHVVNEHLYRGAQPRTDGIKKLASLGVKTIINLRDDDERARAEAAEARAAGLRYFNVPFDTLSRPSDEKVDRVLAIIEAPENQPVFVHCRRGADRTGTIVAIYRITHDGWTSDRAKDEANHYGMAFWEVGMKDYIRDYYKRRMGKDEGGRMKDER